ncbi:hypothetical protein JHL18_25230 [Clostridium sp. YIM B02505]|uniref:Flagellar hook-length control protein FliK n=1 Tax=Clostridium yunnanense TaxID=2800325 RepID=A0ABS1EX74_9CLOT|nr:hypothetical protein [Clostridium yunnanense]MBK1813914.1 hypothetical protein [Clostridium yunnanense]
MPAIWNVNNVYNTGNKKLSSKLTFEVGEKFSGRVVKALDDKNEVMIKLLDGWQFAAEVDAPLEQIKDGLVKFQVDGFVDGKLKLKIVNDNAKDGSSTKDPVDDFIKAEGLSSEDKDIVKLMIRFDMNLTKEGVVRLKSIMNFRDKLQTNPREADAFIDRYLSIKGIPKDSEQGQKIQKLLKEFFVSFNTLNKDELMMMMENGIDLTAENIESFKKLSKNFAVVFENLNLIDHKMNEVQINSDIYTCDLNEILQEKSNDKENISQEKFIDKSKVNTASNEASSNNVKGKLINDTYSSGNSKINMLQLLKSMTANDNDILRNSLKDILSNNKNQFMITGEYDALEGKLNALSDKELISVIRKEVSASGNNMSQINKENIEDGIFKILDRRINLSNKEFSRIQDVIKVVNEAVADSDVLGKDIGKNDAQATKVTLDEANNTNSTSLKPNSAETLSNEKNMKADSNLPNNEIIKNQFSSRNEQVKDLVKSVITHFDLVNITVSNDLNSSIDDIINKVVQQQVNGDGEADGRANTANKNETTSSGETITYKESLPKDKAGLQVTNSSVDKSTTQLAPKEIESSKLDIVKTLLDKHGMDKILEVKMANLDEPTKMKVIEKLNDTIKNQLDGVFSEKLGEKVMELLKNNMSDFKVFNNLNNQYYCLDLPIQLKEKDYPCKLIIKDDRKEGKKIDSTNVKMVVTVKTFNLGTVDGYLNLKNKLLSIDLKCDGKFVKALDIGKSKLQSSLESMGFTSNIVISKKLEDVNLVNCRDFFDDKNISAINVTV